MVIFNRTFIELYQRIGYCSNTILSMTMIKRFVGLTKLLVTTGVPHKYGFMTEVLDLSSGSVKNCSNLSDYPEKVWGAAGGLLFDSTPVICGGHAWANVSKSCHQVDTDGGTTYLFDLMEQRHASGFTMRDDGTLWIAGGWSGESSLRSTELVSTWGSTKGPDLPVPLWGHCMLMVNSNTAMITGGKDYPTESWLYDLDADTGKWTSVPSMTTGRHGHACGILSVSGSQVVVVAGGRLAYQSVELWTVGSNRWIAGPTLPIPISYATSIGGQNGDSMIVAGGMDNGLNHLTHLYELRCSSQVDCFWNKMEQSLKCGRARPVAMFVPDYFCVEEEKMDFSDKLQIGA